LYISALEAKNKNISDKVNELIAKWNFVILCFFLIVIEFFVFKDYLLLKKLFLFKDIGSDTITTYYPQYLHISDYLRSEGIPRWSFNQGMGQNIFPGFPGSIADPFNLILYALGRDYLAYGIVYVEFLKVFLSGIIFYRYLRLLDLTKYTSLTGSLLFAFSGYMILGTTWWAAHSSVVLYGAFLLFAFEKLFKQNSWIWFPSAIFFIANTKIIFYAEFLFLYALFRFIEEKRWQTKKFFLLIVKLAVLGSLGLGISAFTFIGTVLDVLQSPRVTGEVSFVKTLSATPLFFLEQPLHYLTIAMRLFSNDLLGTATDYHGWRNYLEAPSFYCGIITPLLVPQLFLFIGKKKKIIYATFLAFWVFMLVFPHFRYAFYLYSGDYYKNALSFFVPVVLLFYGLHALNKIEGDFRPNLVLLFGTLAGLLAVLFYPFAAVSGHVDGSLKFIVAGLLILYAILISLFRSAIKQYIKYLVIVVICVEAVFLSHITINNRNAITLEEHMQKVGYNDYTVEAVKYIRSRDPGFYRINKSYFSGTAMHTSWNDAKAQGYYGSSSYSSFNQKWYIKFLRSVELIEQRGEHKTRWCPGLIFSPLLQSFASTKYQLIKRNQFNENTFIRSTYVPLGITGDVIILKNNYFLPLGFTYDHYVVSKDFYKATKFQKHITLFNAFVIDELDDEIVMNFSTYDVKGISDGIYDITQYIQDIAERKKHHLRISEHSQNHIKGTIALDKKELLFFSIPYDQGWTAIVDGQKIRPLRVNIGFMGIILDAGDHSVELQYEVPYYYKGLIISIFSLFTYIVIGVHRKMKRPSLKN
jgi:uncharacterized membrane protein YfhO